MKRIILGLVLAGAVAIAAVVLARGATSREPERSVEPARVARRAPEPVVRATGSTARVPRRPGVTFLLTFRKV